MEKDILRNQLFEKYFEVTDGILATDLVDKLAFIPEVWGKLHDLCRKNMRYFDAFSTLEKFRKLEYHERKYLILKLQILKYTIVDIEKMETLTKEQLRKEFNSDFFVKNFDEIETKDSDGNLSRAYSAINYEGDLQELIEFYNQNQTVLNLPSELCYRLNIGDAWTYFYIDFVNASAQIGFQTRDQFLYEQLFLRYNLTASRMQDVQDRIGIERMQEMFEKIRKIKIPKEVISEKLYEQYLIQCGSINDKTKLK